MEKEAAKKAKLIESDADKNEEEVRKRDKQKKERIQKQGDDTILKERKAINTKKAAKTTKERKEKDKEAKGGRNMKERAEDQERNKGKEKKGIEARRDFLLDEGLTTVKLLDDDESAGSRDMNWANDQWEVVDHAVDWTTGKGNYKVIVGMRESVRSEEAEPMWLWGQRSALLQDGMNKSNLDAYIEENCKHPVYREHLNRVVRKKKEKKTAVVEKPKQKKPCDHSSYNLGLSYHADPEVNPGWCAPGKFLWGVECAGCGSPFVQKAPPARDGDGKEPGDPQVPSTTNAVYCCNNLRNRNGTSEEGCSHANCKRCWDAGLLKASRSDGPRASRRSR